MPFQPTGPTTICRVGFVRRTTAIASARSRFHFSAVSLLFGSLSNSKRQRGRIVLVVLGDLLPEGQESLAVLVGLLEDAVVVVHVHHGNQPPLERLLDRPIDAVEELRVDPVGRRLLGMGRPADRDPHRVETGRLDLLEVLFLEHDAPVAFLRRFQGIAQVDAAAEDRLQLLEERIGEDLLACRRGRTAPPEC